MSEDNVEVTPFPEEEVPEEVTETVPGGDTPGITATEIRLRPQLDSMEERLQQAEGVIAQRLPFMAIELSNVQDRLHQVESMTIPEPMEAEPDRIELYKALAAANLEITNAEQDAENKHFETKYATLASVMTAIREPLAKNGLSILQLTEDPGQGVLGIRTILAHESGQTIEDHITMAPPKLDPQGVGSCRTYMRKYAAQAIVGIAGATDDDAEGAMGDPNAYERITPQEAEGILMSADKLFGDKGDDVLDRMLKHVFTTSELEVQNVGDIPSGCAEVAMTSLQKQYDREHGKGDKKAADDV